MTKQLCFALLFVTLLPSTVWAHLPELEDTNTNVTVSEPEISKVFYGSLNGQPVTYIINTEQPFNCYLQLLTPSSDLNQTILSAKIINDQNQVVSILDGTTYNWQPFYEPFGGDNYFKGPDFKSKLASGKYKIEITSQNNLGPYALAVGEIERFTVGDVLKTIKILPALKQDFFHEPWWRILINPFYLGLFVIGLLVILITVCLIRVKIIHYRTKRSL